MVGFPYRTSKDLTPHAMFHLYLNQTRSNLKRSTVVIFWQELPTTRFPGLVECEIVLKPLLEENYF